MSLKRVRSHKEGISNIDFRTKGDIDNIRIFDPWKLPKEFGSMGYSHYRNPDKIFKSLFDPSLEINTQKDIVNDYPDPRYHSTAQFYKKNKILINTKTFFNSEKVANLEETFKGKEIFNGDSTNIAEIMRIRKGKNYEKEPYKLKNPIKEPFSIEDNKIQEEKIRKLVKDKKKGNKNAIQETQLVKINTYFEKNNMINIKKIEEVRQALRRRYGNRKNIYKIFQLWARTFPNKITVYDAYKMINSLSIPINYNETKAFIASGSNFGNEYLNLEEFANLIYEPIKMDLGKGNTKVLYGGKEVDKIANNITENNMNEVDLRNIEKLKDFISERIRVLNKNIKELCKEKYSFKEDNKSKNYNVNLNLVDYDKFLKGILSLKPSDNLGKEKYIKKLFDEYKNSNNLVDIKFFGENIYEKNTKEFMSKFKDRNIEIAKEQYNEKFNKLQNYVNENSKKVKPLFFQKKLDLDSQLFEKKILKEQKKDSENQLNSTIPSTKWLHHIYDNRKEHYNILNRVEHSFSAKPSFKQNIVKCNTRFGACPKWKNTAEILIGDETSSTFINEKDRFTLNRDIGKEDKKMKQLLDLGKQNRIRTALQKAENNRFMKIFLKEEKKIYSDMAKSKRISLYEENTKNRNFIIE